MKLILHHLAKDIRAQRWLLLLWAFVIAIQAGVDLMILQPDYDLANFADKIRSSPLLGLIGGMLWIFLIVQLIQIEPVTGSTSFWLTRPIPRRVYIPSKLLFILLFLVVPSLLLTPLNMLEMHTDRAVIWQFVKTDLVWQAAFAIGVLWLATFTRSIGQFFLAVGVLIPLFVIAFGIREMALLRSGSGFHYELSLAQSFLFAVVLFLGLTVSLIFQHVVRKTRTGLWIGGISTGVAVLLGLTWPFALPSRFMLSLLPASKSYSSKTVRVDFTPGWETNVTWRKSTDVNGIPLAYGTVPDHDGSATVKASITARVPLSPAKPTGTEIDYIEGVTAHFRAVDGHTQNLPAKDVLDEDKPFDVKAAMQADLPDITIDSGTEATTPSVGIFRLAPEMVGTLRGKHGLLGLEIYGHVENFVRKAAIPLENPAFAQLPGEIFHVRRQDSETQTIFGIEIPTGVNNPVLAVWSSNYNHQPYQLGPTTFYLLVDSEKHTGEILRQRNNFRMPTSVGLSARSGWRDFLPLGTDEKLSGKVLYIYELSPGNFFNASLSAPDFVMNPP
jgi:hypothetical protein